MFGQNLPLGVSARVFASSAPLSARVNAKECVNVGHIFTGSNKKLVVTGATLLVTGALLVVTRS